MMNDTQRPDYRQANGLSLAVRHMAARSEKHIHARQVDGKLVWLVESQTEAGKYYTVARAADGWAFDCCDCEDAAYRHQVCKHQRAVEALTSPAPVIKWTSDTRKASKRTEIEEEI